MTSDSRKLVFQADKEVNIYGDIEVLILLRYHYQVTRDAIKVILRKVFKNLVSKALDYIDNAYLRAIVDRKNTTN